MKLSDEIEILEKNMFDSVHGALVGIERNKLDEAKAYIATVEILNSEYKDITKVDFVKQSTIIDLYERLWRKSNA